MTPLPHDLGIIYVDMEKYRVSFKNIGVWFADQLSHPATLFSRKSWGVFSVYAHIRRSDRLPKKSSPDKRNALQTAMFMSNKYGGRYSIYKCVFCDGWHIAKESAVTQKIRVRNPKKSIEKDRFLKNST